MTISLSYAYWKGLDRRIVSSPYVQIAIHPSTELRDVASLDCPPMQGFPCGLGTKIVFMSTVSAMSSALWPVTM